MKKKFGNGSRINIWKQDPTVESLGARATFIHTKVNAGPSDNQIAIKGLPSFVPDSNGDFLFPPPEQYIVDDIYNPPEITVNEQRFDAAHSFAVVRKVLTMYQRLLGRELKWVWNLDGNNEERLNIYPHASRGRGAFYDRNTRSIYLQYCYIHNGPPIFTCRSIDVVSHETAHAIFDSLKPNWNVTEPGRGIPILNASLQESLCDLTSVFFILSQLDLVEYIVAQTKANLHFEDNILATWCEQFEEIPGYIGPRSAINDFKLTEAGTQIHRISEVFTGAIYDTLSDIFNTSRDPDLRNDAETLYEVSQYMLDLLVKSVIYSPEENATFADVANEMIKITELSGRFNYAKLIRDNFIYREILTEEGSENHSDLFAQNVVADFSGCCGTMDTEIRNV